MGHSLGALTDVKLKESIDRHLFEQDLRDVPQVLGAIHTTGEFDYQLRIATRSSEELQSVIDNLRRLGARDIQSRIVLGEVNFNPARLLSAP